jgi:hypothetical protein
MQKEDINKLIKNTIESFNGIKPAECHPFIYTKVREKISSLKKEGIVFGLSMGYVWKLALTFIILAVLNIFSLVNYTNKESEQYITSKQDINSFIDEYSINNSTYNY